MTEPPPRERQLAERITALELELARERTRLAHERDVAQRETIDERKRANEANARLRTFRQEVVDVALKYAKINDWCDDVSDALEELGLADLLPSVTRIVTLEVKVLVEGELGWDEDEYVEAAWDNVRDGTLEDHKVTED